jgi:NiFe hydrogenase small subunit HydA
MMPHNVPAASRKFNLLWLQSGGCGGCTLSLMGAEAPDLLTGLDIASVDLLWHPSLSEAGGADVHALLDNLRSGTAPLDILCLEGAVMRGPAGTGRFHTLSGGLPMMTLIADMAARARYVLAIGACAAYGGVSAAGDNTVEACGLAFEAREPGGLLGPGFRSGAGLPVINVAGCPTHPGWVLESLMMLASGTLTAADLDAFGRPRFYADHLVHHGCTRNEFYEYKASARELSQLGCMMEHLGCIGTQVHGDCNIRAWNGEGSCTRGGYPCIGCTEPQFGESDHPFLETPKRAGIPVGLPTDMPKAWFVALASLSKAATPERLRRNAVAGSIAVPPSCNPGKAAK